MTQEDIIRHWADRWCSLAAWRAPITMRVKLKKHNGRGRLGVAYSYQGRCQVNLTGDLGHDLATVLHELAHLAAPNSEMHGDHWRELFVAAAVEALGGSVDDYEIDVSVYELDKQVEDATRNWLKHSGQAAVLRAIGVMS